MKRYLAAERTFWNTPSVVRRFASDSPSFPLKAFLTRLKKRRSRPLRALDVGCGAGRNLTLLAEMGFDAYACDSASAMVRAARQRLVSRWGKAVAATRIVRATINHLPYRTDSFDAVISHGAFHNSRSLAELKSAIRETARVLKRGGFLYLNCFYFSGALHNLRRVSGIPHLFITPARMRMVLLPKNRILEYLAVVGLYPSEKILSYRKRFFTGGRDVMKGIFRKQRLRKREEPRRTPALTERSQS